MKCLLVRFRPKTRYQPALAAHDGGRSLPREAVPRDGTPPSIPLPGLDQKEFAAAREWLERWREGAKRRKGKPGAEAVDVIIAGPPPRESAEKWTDQQVLDWGRDIVDTFREALPPEALFLEGALHLWERAPHAHALILPVADGRLSWKATQEHLCRSLAGDVPADRRRQMSLIQDGCHAAFGEPYGLERGEVGSKARHRPPDRDKGLIERTADTQAMAARVQSEADRRVEAADRAADKRAAEAERRADDKVLGAERRADERARAAESAAARKVDQAVEDAYGAEIDAEDHRFASDLLVVKAKADADINLERRKLSEKSQQRMLAMLTAEDQRRELEARRAEDEEAEEFERKRREKASAEQKRDAAAAAERRREIEQRFGR